MEIDEKAFAEAIGRTMEVGYKGGVREYMRAFVSEYEAAKAPATEQPVECTPFRSGDTHCNDCPCRYGRHIREPKLNNLNRRDSIENLFYAMRALFGDSYQPSRIQAETLLNTMLESLDLRSTQRELSSCDRHAQSMPHFTLIAKDNLSIQLVAQWIKNAEFVHVSAGKIQQAKAKLETMKQWRKENRSDCKNPD